MTDQTKEKQEFLTKLLDKLDNNDWTNDFIEKISLEHFSDTNYAYKLFGDVENVVEFYLTEQNKKFKESLEKINKEDKRISELVRLAILKKIEITNREHLKRSLKFLLNPKNIVISTNSVYRTSDTIWAWVGDTDVDLNYYSKRASLSFVLTATFSMYANCEDMEKIESFLDKQLAFFSNFGKLKNKLKSCINLG